MSSSFPAARFPALPLANEKEVAEPLYKDKSAPAEEPSDETLIARICDADEEALALLFRRYTRVVWSIAERILRDKAEADDVMQEVFLRVYRNAASFDSSKGAPRTLIVHMAYQCSFTRRAYLASRHRFYDLAGVSDLGKVLVASVSHSFYDTSMEAHFGREGLQSALGNLSEDQRETLRLFFYEGYTLDEIAERLGQARENVKHHYYRALDKLRQRLPNRPATSPNQE